MKPENKKAALWSALTALVIGILTAGSEPWWLDYFKKERHEEWISLHEYNKLFKEMTNEHGKYPKEVYGRLKNGEQQYRALWVNKPSDLIDFDSRSSLPKKLFDEKNNALTSQGYSLEWKSSFVSAEGNEVIQATWEKYRY